MSSSSIQASSQFPESGRITLKSNYNTLESIIVNFILTFFGSRFNVSFVTTRSFSTYKTLLINNPSFSNEIVDLKYKCTFYLLPPCTCFGHLTQPHLTNMPGHFHFHQCCALLQIKLFYSKNCPKSEINFFYTYTNLRNIEIVYRLFAFSSSVAPV